MQKLSSGSNQSSIFASVVDMFFSLFFLAKYLKFSAARIEYGGVVRTWCIKKHSHRLALSFVIFDFCATRIEYGARDAAHSTSSAYSDGGRPPKKSMGKLKKCALTVKVFSVTTWSLTSGENKCFFLISFFEKNHFVASKKHLLAYRIYKKQYFLSLILDW